MKRLDRYGIEITLANGEVVVRRDAGYYGPGPFYDIDLHITDNGTAVILLLGVAIVGEDRSIPDRVAEAFAPGTWLKAVRYFGEPKGDRSWLNDQ